jgi:hypothetical protein
MGLKKFVKKAKSIGGALTGGAIAGLPGFMFGGGKNLMGGQGGGPNLGSPVPQFQMRKTEEFIKEDKAPQIGGPDGASAMQRRFQTARERVSGDSNAALDQGRDQLQRKFASQGAVGSGAQIKLESKMNDQSQRQKADALQAVNDAETQAVEQRDAQQADLDFRNKIFNFERGSKLHELDLAERQQQISSSQDQYNARLNEFLNAPPKKGMLSGLLDGIL